MNKKRWNISVILKNWKWSLFSEEKRIESTSTSINGSSSRSLLDIFTGTCIYVHPSNFPSDKLKQYRRQIIAYPSLLFTDNQIYVAFLLASTMWILYKFYIEPFSLWNHATIYWYYLICIIDISLYIFLIILYFLTF